MKKKLIYIACPYSIGDVAVNVHNAIKAAEIVVVLGAIPYMPLWTHFWHFMNPHPWEYWIQFDEYYVSICDVVWRLPGESKGADIETKQAEDLMKPVFYDLKELTRWLKDAV